MNVIPDPADPVRNPATPSVILPADWTGTPWETYHLRGPLGPDGAPSPDAARLAEAFRGAVWTIRIQRGLWALTVPPSSASGRLWNRLNCDLDAFDALTSDTLTLILTPVASREKA